MKVERRVDTPVFEVVLHQLAVGDSTISVNVDPMLRPSSPPYGRPGGKVH